MNIEITGIQSEARAIAVSMSLVRKGFDVSTRRLKAGWKISADMPVGVQYNGGQL